MVYRKGEPIISIGTQINSILKARHTSEGVELFVEWEGQPTGGVCMFASRLDGVVAQAPDSLQKAEPTPCEPTPSLGVAQIREAAAQDLPPKSPE